MKNTLTTLLLFTAFFAQAQVGIGVSTTTMDASAMLDVSSTTKGFLPPRMTYAQLKSLTYPAEGLMLYCTDCIPKGLFVFDGTNWSLSSGGVSPLSPSSGGTGEVFAYDCSTASAGTLSQGIAVSGVTQTITATVTTVGTYSISTTVNGVTFAASGTFSGTGAQNIVLTASGTPTAMGSNTFTLNTTPNCNFSRTTTAITSALLSSYTSSSSGGCSWDLYETGYLGTILSLSNGYYSSSLLELSANINNGQTSSVSYTAANTANFESQVLYLSNLNYQNVQVRVGNGGMGFDQNSTDPNWAASFGLLQGKTITEIKLVPITVQIIDATSGNCDSYSYNLKWEFYGY